MRICLDKSVVLFPIASLAHASWAFVFVFVVWCVCLCREKKRLGLINFIVTYDTVLLFLLPSNSNAATATSASSEMRTPLSVLDVFAELSQERKSSMKLPESVWYHVI